MFKRLLTKLCYRILNLKPIDRLTPLDWKGFQIGDIIYVEQDDDLSYIGLAVITALVDFENSPAVHIAVDGVDQGIVTLDRIRFQYRGSA